MPQAACQPRTREYRHAANETIAASKMAALQSVIEPRV
jgi:hypothetical protein